MYLGSVQPGAALYCLVSASVQASASTQISNTCPASSQWSLSKWLAPGQQISLHNQLNKCQVQLYPPPPPPQCIRYSLLKCSEVILTQSTECLRHCFEVQSFCHSPPKCRVAAISVKAQSISTIFLKSADCLPFSDKVQNVHHSPSKYTHIMLAILSQSTKGLPFFAKYRVPSTLCRSTECSHSPPKSRNCYSSL